MCAPAFMLALLGFMPAALADTVEFRGSTSIECTVLQKAPDHVTVLYRSGVIQIPRSEIANVTETAAPAESASGVSQPVRHMPDHRTVLVALAGKPWASDLRQIPATVIDVGVLRNVPYKSHRAGGDYEINVYGDPDAPAGFEIGVHRALLDQDAPKQNCINFVCDLLSDPADRDVVRGLARQKDKKVRDGLTFEITPPTDADAYGGWWVSVYNESTMDSQRASQQELKAITVARSAAKPPAKAPPSASARPAEAVEAMQEWTPQDMGYARVPIVRERTVGGFVYVRGYSRRHGIYVHPFAHSAAPAIAAVRSESTAMPATYDYDVLVVGAGHAGAEAAAAAARLGAATALLTSNLDTIAQMSCNPAIGGVAKGQIVREIDALGGLMGRAIDATGIQFRMLNRSKGPAMHGPRAQADRHAYQRHIRRLLEEQPGLTLRQETVEDLLVEGPDHAPRICGVRVRGDAVYRARSVVLCAGTFLRGLLHVGPASFPGGRMGEGTSDGLSQSLQRLGLRLARFKTGTSPRLHGLSIDYAQTELQPGDEQPEPFSFLTERIECEQLPCWITHTNEAVHALVRANLAPRTDVQRADPVHGAALLPLGRDQDRPLCRQAAAPDLPRARGTPDPRSLRQRPLDQPAPRRPGRDGPAGAGPRNTPDPPLRIRHRVRLRPARATEALAGNQARGRAVLGRADQRDHGLRGGGRPRAAGRRQRRAGPRRPRADRVGSRPGLPGRDDRRPGDPRRR